MEKWAPSDWAINHNMWQTENPREDLGYKESHDPMWIWFVLQNGHTKFASGSFCCCCCSCCFVDNDTDYWGTNSWRKSDRHLGKKKCSWWWGSQLKIHWNWWREWTTSSHTLSQDITGRCRVKTQNDILQAQVNAGTSHMNTALLGPLGNQERTVPVSIGEAFLFLFTIFYFFSSENLIGILFAQSNKTDGKKSGIEIFTNKMGGSPHHLHVKET